MNVSANIKSKIFLILLALRTTSLASPTSTPSASPASGFTPMVEWRCTIDVAADRIALVDKQTGDYLDSGPLSKVLPPTGEAQSGQDRSRPKLSAATPSPAWEKGTPTADQLCHVAVSFTRTVIDKITPPDNIFTPVIKGGYTYTNGQFETIVQVGQVGGQVGHDALVSFEWQVVKKAQDVFVSALTDALSSQARLSEIFESNPREDSRELGEALIELRKRLWKMEHYANKYLKTSARWKQVVLHSDWARRADNQRILVGEVDKSDACARAAVDYGEAADASFAPESGEAETKRLVAARKRLLDSMAALK